MAWEMAVTQGSKPKLTMASKMVILDFDRDNWAKMESSEMTSDKKRASIGL